MIDIEAAKRRTAWLKFLQPGDRVTFISAAERHVARVEAVEPHSYRLWIKFTCHDGTEVRTWVWHDTGDCPGARTRIEPAADSQTGDWNHGTNDIAKWRELVMWYGIAMADLDLDDAIQADIKNLLDMGGCIDAP